LFASVGGCVFAAVCVFASVCVFAAACVLSAACVLAAACVSLLLPPTLIISAAAVDPTVAVVHSAVGVLAVADVPSCARLLVVTNVLKSLSLLWQNRRLLCC